MSKDAEKNNSAQMLGWSVLVYTSEDLKVKPVQIIGEVEAFLSAKTK